MNEIAYVNGRYLPLAEAVTSIEDRGYQFGDGVYEVVRYYGRRPLRLKEHLRRLDLSVGEMRIKGAPSAAEWHQILDKLVQECDLPDDPSQKFSLYQQVSRGIAPRNHLFPKDITASCVAYFRKATTYPEEMRNSGVSLLVQPDERWTKCNIKSVCLLPAIMAKQAAHDAGCFEALLVRDGFVTEGGSTNAFCIIGEEIYTHPADALILSGVTRKMAIEAADKAGIKVHEKAMTLEQFLSADEAFISSTTLNVMPVTRINDKPIGTGSVGKVTLRVNDAIEEIIRSEVGMAAPAVSNK